MSQVCHYCGKKPLVGNNVSHSNIKIRKRWIPNLKKMRASLKVKGKAVTRTIRACTRCIRSGKVVRPVKRIYKVESTAATA